MLSETHLSELNVKAEDVAVLLIDHGSRRAESNDLLHDVAKLFQETSGYGIVEAAHMELAEPTIDQAFCSAVERGASFVIAFPYFLSPGRHWNQDVPNLVKQASKPFPQVRYLVASPLGIHPLMMRVIEDRVSHCIARNLGEVDRCDICDGKSNCLIRPQD